MPIQFKRGIDTAFVPIQSQPLVDYEPLCYHVLPSSLEVQCRYIQMVNSFFICEQEHQGRWRNKPEHQKLRWAYSTSAYNNNHCRKLLFRWCICSFEEYLLGTWKPTIPCEYSTRNKCVDANCEILSFECKICGNRCFEAGYSRDAHQVPMTELRAPLQEYRGLYYNLGWR